MSQEIRLVSGYRGSGKDTLVQRLNTGQCRYSFAVYCRPGRGGIDHPGYRLAFADEVKREVREELQLPTDFDAKEEIVKDGRTFRSFCIEKGCKALETDPYHWARRVLYNLDPSRGIPTISDWRFPKEYEYASTFGKVTTFRIFRKATPIPPEGEVSERSLDSFLTDYLVLPLDTHRQEFEVVKDLFPQYRDYVWEFVL